MSNEGVGVEHIVGESQVLVRGVFEERSGVEWRREERLGWGIQKASSPPAF
jgi:hypothetical protein